MFCLGNTLQLSLSPWTILRCSFQTSASPWKGHSKWQNIKHIKASKDMLKGRLIARQMRNVRLAVLEGGGSPNPALNRALRNAIEHALYRNVPQSTIKAALKKMSETPDSSKMHRHIYGGRLYGKVFLLIVVYTDNLSLTENQLARPFKKHNFFINDSQNLFTERGVIDALARPEVRIDHFVDDCETDAIECGAEDVEIHDAAQRQVTFYCDPKEFISVKQKLTKCGYKIVDGECVFIWEKSKVKLTAAEVKNYQEFKERLQNGLDGFDTIYDNVDDADDEHV